MIQVVELELVNDLGRRCGVLRVSCLPGHEYWHDIDTIEIVPEGSTTGASVRLLEETTYVFEIDLTGDANLDSIEPTEVFSRDDYELGRGRIHTKRNTGTVQVAVSADDVRLTCEFEVRSRKLDYESEYRRMLDRLAQESAELIQSSFAASQFVGFEPNEVKDARTLYQRFSFIESRLQSETFLSAIETIRNSPHSNHQPEVETVNPARHLKSHRRLVQQFAMSAQRQPLANPVAGMTSIPLAVTRDVAVESLDTTPNRFLRFALEHWRTLAGQVGTLLTGTGVEATRGRREARRIEAQLDHLLGTLPAVLAAGKLGRFPAANTVLQARPGYREVFRSYLLCDVAASVSWDGGQDVFGAGKRDVATLYEYWVFLELARIVGSLDGFRSDPSELVKTTTNGVSLELRRGKQVVIRAQGRRRSRSMTIELWFNRTFNHSPSGDGSWTVKMRPDCSLRIAPGLDSWQDDTWIHFDAKYRINQYAEIIDTDAPVDEEETDTSSNSSRSHAKRDDLRKMHAYRDAIRRTSGAYVIYPGDDTASSEALEQHHELLPGLGAFVLRPSETGEATIVAASNLAKFLSDIIDHAASQATSRDRARYWQGMSYGKGDPPPELEFSPLLTKPPADTKVLFGFVHGQTHVDWIQDNSLYNLRADPTQRGSVDLTSTELSADFVVLYDKNGAQVGCWKTTQAFFVRSRQEMLDSGYVEPGSSSYLCMELGGQVELEIDGSLAKRFGNEDGSPAVHTWLDVFSP